MKKVLALMLAMVLVLSLAACGGGNNSNNGEEITTEPASLKVGDTAKGQICSFTVNSVEYLDKIEDGIIFEPKHLVSYDPDKFIFKDYVVDSGYSVAKIDYSFDYAGKKGGDLIFGIALDYDNGYIYDECKEHFDECKKKSFAPESEDYYSGRIALSENESEKIATYEINDPITYKGDKGVKYIVIDNEVKNNTNKALVLKVSASISSDDNDTESRNFSTGEEIYIFDVR